MEEDKTSAKACACKFEENLKKITRMHPGVRRIQLLDGKPKRHRANDSAIAVPAFDDATVHDKRPHCNWPCSRDVLRLGLADKFGRRVQAILRQQEDGIECIRPQGITKLCSFRWVDTTLLADALPSLFWAPGLATALFREPGDLDICERS